MVMKKVVMKKVLDKINNQLNLVSIPNLLLAIGVGILCGIVAKVVRFEVQFLLISAFLIIFDFVYTLYVKDNESIISKVVAYILLLVIARGLDSIFPFINTDFAAFGGILYYSAGGIYNNLKKLIKK